MQNLGKDILVKEFSQRKSNNAMYSLRAFARDLEINRTTLSEVMSEKRSISRKNALKLVEKLQLTPIQSDALIRSCEQGQSVSDHNYLQIQDDVFHLMSDWYYFAILNLAKLKYSPADPEWVAEQLNIPILEVKSALDRLTRLGFIEIHDQQLTRTVRSLSTTKEIPSRALKIHHCQTLDLAKKALEEVPIEERHISSVTMAIDPNKLPRAKEILYKCKRKIAKLLEAGEPGQVYSLSFQLFPLTRKR